MLIIIAGSSTAHKLLTKASYSHTHVPLLPSAIIWYDDSLQLERSP